MLRRVRIAGTTVPMELEHPRRLRLKSSSNIDKPESMRVSAPMDSCQRRLYQSNGFRPVIGCTNCLIHSFA